MLVLSKIVIEKKRSNCEYCKCHYQSNVLISHVLASNGIRRQNKYCCTFFSPFDSKNKKIKCRNVPKIQRLEIESVLIFFVE